MAVKVTALVRVPLARSSSLLAMVVRWLREVPVSTARRVSNELPWVVSVTRWVVVAVQVYQMDLPPPATGASRSHSFGSVK
jgi:hypothetical protein